MTKNNHRLKIQRPNHYLTWICWILRKELENWELDLLNRSCPSYLGNRCRSVDLGIELSCHDYTGFETPLKDHDHCCFYTPLFSRITVHFQEYIAKFFISANVGIKHGKLQLGIYQFLSSCEYFAGVHWR
jgi:hypothetical protein